MAVKKKNIKKKNKKKNNKTHKKLIKAITQTVTLSAILCLTAYAVYTVARFVIKPSDALIIERGVISETERVEGYIIRDEIVVNTQGTETELIEVKSEGEKVAKGEEIFRHKTVNEESINEQIENLNNQIQEAMEGKTNLLNSDVKALDTQIDKILTNIMNENDIQTIVENKKDIANYMEKKAKIAGELSPANSYINTLIEQKTALENQLSSESNYEIAPISGMVSYRVDGLEDKLTPAKLDELTTEYLEGLNLKTGQIISKNVSKGKVINSFECYIVVPRDKNAQNEITEGDRINLRISTDKTVKATVQSVKTEGETQLIVFKITQGVEDLIKYRKISIDIVWWEKEGLKVPHSSIIYENGLSYVVRTRAGIKSKILVKIIKENDNYSIIGNYSTEELKELGFSVEEIRQMRKINIYDEILVNPDIKDVSN